MGHFGVVTGGGVVVGEEVQSELSPEQSWIGTLLEVGVTFGDVDAELLDKVALVDGKTDCAILGIEVSPC